MGIVFDALTEEASAVSSIGRLESVGTETLDFAVSHIGGLVARGTELDLDEATSVVGTLSSIGHNFDSRGISAIGSLASEGFTDSILTPSIDAAISVVGRLSSDGSITRTVESIPTGPRFRLFSKANESASYANSFLGIIVSFGSSPAAGYGKIGILGSAGYVGIETDDSPYIVLDATLPAFAAEFLIQPNNDLRLDAPLPAFTAQIEFGMALDATLPALTAEFAIQNQNPIVIDAVLPAFTAEFQIITGEVLAIDATLPAFIAEFHFGMVLDAVLPAFTAEFVVTAGNSMELIATLPALTAEFAIGAGGAVLSLDATLPAFTMGGTVEIDAVLPALRAYMRFESDAQTEAYAVNIANRAVTRFTNYGFTRIVRFAGSHYGVMDGALYKLDGDDDDGQSILAEATTASTDFDDERLKRVSYAYLGMRETDGVTFHMVGDEDKSYRYQIPNRADALGTRRIELGKGYKHRYWSVSMSNREGGTLEVDTLGLLVEDVGRKI